MKKLLFILTFLTTLFLKAQDSLLLKETSLYVKSSVSFTQTGRTVTSKGAHLLTKRGVSFPQEKRPI